MQCNAAATRFKSSRCTVGEGAESEGEGTVGNTPFTNPLLSFQEDELSVDAYTLDFHFRVCEEESWESRGMNYSAWEKDTDAVLNKQLAEGRETHKLLGMT